MARPWGVVLGATLLLCFSSHQHGSQIAAQATSADDRFLVKVNGLYGYIDKAGNIVIPPRYTVAQEFQEHRAMFGRDWKLYGFLDAAGREIVPMRFVTSGAFSDGLARVTVLRTDAAGGERNAIGFVGPGGQWVIQPDSSRFDWADDFHEGLALATSATTGAKRGFLNRRGQWAIPPQFDWAEPFSEGLAAVDIGGKRGCKRFSSITPERLRSEPPAISHRRFTRNCRSWELMVDVAVEANMVTWTGPVR